MRKVFIIVCLSFLFCRISAQNKDTSLINESIKNLVEYQKMKIDNLMSNIESQTCYCIDSLLHEDIEIVRILAGTRTCIYNNSSFLILLILRSKLFEVNDSSKIHLTKIGNWNVDRNYFELEKMLTINCVSFGKVCKLERNYDDVFTGQDSAIISICNKGFHEFKKGSYRLALNFFEDAILLNPKLSRCWDLIGRCNFELGNYEEASSAYLQSLSIEKNGLNASLAMAELHELYNKINLSRNNYVEISKLYPQSAESYFKLGVLFFKQCKFEKGLDFCCKALYNRSKNTLPYFIDTEELLNEYYVKMKEIGKLKQFYKILTLNQIEVE